METNQEKIILKTLKRMFDEGELKEGMKLYFDENEKSYICTSEGGVFYSLKTDDFDKALLKFYTKEILSDRVAKRYFDNVKIEVIMEEGE